MKQRIGKLSKISKVNIIFYVPGVVCSKTLFVGTKKNLFFVTEFSVFVMERPIFMLRRYRNRWMFMIIVVHYSLFVGQVKFIALPTVSNCIIHTFFDNLNSFRHEVNKYGS